MADRPHTPERLADRRRPWSIQAAAPAAYSPKMFQEAYGIGETKLYEEIKTGRLVARKLGTRTIILASDAEAWAQALPRVGWGK